MTQNVALTSRRIWTGLCESSISTRGMKGSHLYIFLALTMQYVGPQYAPLLNVQIFARSISKTRTRSVDTTFILFSRPLHITTQKLDTVKVCASLVESFSYIWKPRGSSFQQTLCRFPGFPSLMSLPPYVSILPQCFLASRPCCQALFERLLFAGHARLPH